MSQAGPLADLRIIEMAGIGPAPFCAMLLADFGAEVVRIARPNDQQSGTRFPPELDFLNRKKRTIIADLKDPDCLSQVRDMIIEADVLIEGFRPGVMERLGLGPATFSSDNPRLIYGRLTGWGQDGPLARSAGHDINYISITGALDAIGAPGGAPIPPLNLVGDFAGGALYLTSGILAALHEMRTTGKGNVIDAAIVDGVVHLMTLQFMFQQMGAWVPDRGANLIDGGAPFYSIYKTRDDLYISIGAIEPRFYDELICRIGLSDALLPDQYDKDRWPELRKHLADVFASRTRAEWCALLSGTDVCFAPVLSLDEAASHPQIDARRSILCENGIRAPAPAENGGEKVDHGSGGMSPLRAA